MEVPLKQLESDNFELKFMLINRILIILHYSMYVLHGTQVVLQALNNDFLPKFRLARVLIF